MKDVRHSGLDKQCSPTRASAQGVDDSAVKGLWIVKRQSREACKGNPVAVDLPRRLFSHPQSAIAQRKSLEIGSSSGVCVDTCQGNSSRTENDLHGTETIALSSSDGNTSISSIGTDSSRGLERANMTWSTTVGPSHCTPDDDRPQQGVDLTTGIYASGVEAPVHYDNDI